MAPASLRKPTATALRIVRQVTERLDGHGPSGDAFVVSVYGEWGIGKTRCLQDVRDTFAAQLGDAINALPQGTPDRITVPVLFDPWQYEHEEHLVVPLLKTIELALMKVAAQVDALPKREGARAEEFTERAKKLGGALKHAGGVFGDVAVALLSGFKFKFAPLKDVFGIEMELSGKDAIESARKSQEKREAAQLAAAQNTTPKQTAWQRFTGTRAPPPYAEGTKAEPAAPDAKPGPTPADLAHQRLSQRESLYFDVRTALSALTEGNTPKLRLVVLIDDLDRCLPEKAIQVLESVKLFLNVPGFSFVLAVDDEVVERGIAHRYRAYLPVGADGAAMTAAPISGAEYLEKIVHLPVHLQRWTRDEAGRFLRETYPAMFAPPKPVERYADDKTGAAAGSARAAVQQGAGTGAQRSEELVKLVLDAIPLVPRKLIRLAEALEFQHQHFSDLHATDLWHPLHAARVVALQQLYPALYRYLRLRANRYWRMFELRRDDYGEPAIEAGKPLHELRDWFKFRNKAPTDPGAPTTTAATTIAPQTRAQVDVGRENLNLLEWVEGAGMQRGNPDPIALFANTGTTAERTPEGIGRGLELDEFAQLYLHGLAVAAPPAVIPTAPSAAAERIAVVDDPVELLDRLLYADTLGRHEYLQAKKLAGRLPDAFFDGLLNRLADLPEARARVTDIEWLRDIAEITGAEQLLRLYRVHMVLDKLASATPGRSDHA